MNIVRAFAFGVGILGLIATYLFAGLASTFGLQIWAAFLGWGSFFAAGETNDAYVKSLAGSFWGAAWATVALALFARFGNAGLPVHALIFGGTCGAMVLGTRLPLLSVMLAQVYGYVATAGFGFLTGTSGLNFSLGEGPFTTVAVSMVAGASFGYATRLSLPSSSPIRLSDRVGRSRLAVSATSNHPHIGRVSRQDMTVASESEERTDGRSYSHCWPLGEADREADRGTSRIRCNTDLLLLLRMIA